MTHEQPADRLIRRTRFERALDALVFLAGSSVAGGIAGFMILL